MGAGDGAGFCGVEGAGAGTGGRTRTRGGGGRSQDSSYAPSPGTLNRVRTGFEGESSADIGALGAFV